MRRASTNCSALSRACSKVDRDEIRQGRETSRIRVDRAGGKPPWQNGAMPSKHKHPAITPRPAPELRERAKLAVAEVNSTLNGHIIDFLRWLVGDTDELPPRPKKPIPPFKQ